MNLLKNINIFHSFSDMIKILSTLTNILRGIALLFLVVQVVMLFVQSRRVGFKNALKLS